MAKQLYTLEFPVRCSPVILYDFLASPAGFRNGLRIELMIEIIFSVLHGMVLLRRQKYWKKNKTSSSDFIGCILQKKNSLNSKLKNQKSLIKQFLLSRILQRRKRSKTKAWFGITR